mmetsp:Transcript_61309/g.144851  ORF Transcript_61309/g.144851 Transcript_61309/m.144851 type:complete len:207 (-) Transcript_61309:722-1342(-)
MPPRSPPPPGCRPHVSRGWSGSGSSWGETPPVSSTSSTATPFSSPVSQPTPLACLAPPPTPPWPCSAPPVSGRAAPSAAGAPPCRHSTPVAPEQRADCESPRGRALPPRGRRVIAPSPQLTATNATHCPQYPPITPRSCLCPQLSVCSWSAAPVLPMLRPSSRWPLAPPLQPPTNADAPPHLPDYASGSVPRRPVPMLPLSLRERR